VPADGPWVEVTRRGRDVLILGVGPEIRLAEEAAVDLEGEGLEATVAGVRRVHPLDARVLGELIEAHRAVITVEDNVLAGGFGSAVLELMADAGIERPVVRAGLPDSFVGHGSVDLLRRDVGLTVEAIVAAALRLGRHPGDRG
jgi:1-deoxy-D-xylulose-5-phosphate synthase